MPANTVREVDYRPEVPFPIILCSQRHRPSVAPGILPCITVMKARRVGRGFGLYLEIQSVQSFTPPRLLHNAGPQTSCCPTDWLRTALQSRLSRHPLFRPRPSYGHNQTWYIIRFRGFARIILIELCFLLTRHMLPGCLMAMLCCVSHEIHRSPAGAFDWTLTALAQSWMAAGRS